MYKRQKPTIHFVGIGGSGMNGLAQILLSQGCTIQGSDISIGEVTENLRRQGAKIFEGHLASNIHEGVSVVVVSSAIRGENPEISKALELHIPIIHRAEMLAELMRLRLSISVAGTHGKTTTTSLLGSTLISAGLDPTVFVGGRLNATGTFGKYGDGDWLVAESDESDGSFMKLLPTIAIVTNIDNDHLEHYQDMGRMKQTFSDFLNRLPFYGRGILCGDEPNIQDILSDINRPTTLYGFETYNDLIASHIEVEKGGTAFDCHFKGEYIDRFKVPLFGNHNVLNSLAVIGTCMEMEIETSKIKEGIASFNGVDRRFTFRGNFKKAEVFDDYGHHPTEIKAVLQAARSYKKDGRIIVCFQPHRYTRTRDVLNQFGTCFTMANEIILFPIYNAGEKPIPGIDIDAVANQIRVQSGQSPMIMQDFEECESYLNKVVNSSDLILCLGAGSITKFSTMLAKD